MNNTQNFIQETEENFYVKSQQHDLRKKGKFVLFPNTMNSFSSSIK